MLAQVHFRSSEMAGSSTTLASNVAAGRGGGIMAWASLLIDFQHQLNLFNNSAGLDGGGISLAGNAGIYVADEGCPNSICSTRGDGNCDPACLTRGCNW